MTIECYLSNCEHHSCHTDPNDGPFCYQGECSKDSNWILRSGVERLLHENAMKVIFTKKDGTERTMICTTNPDLIPGDKAPRGATMKTNPEIKRVFDLEKNEWRSFRWDSMKKATINYHINQ